MDFLKTAYNLGLEQAFIDAGLEKEAGWLSELFGLGEQRASQGFKEFSKKRFQNLGKAEAADNAARDRILKNRSVVRATGGMGSANRGATQYS